MKKSTVKKKVTGYGGFFAKRTSTVKEKANQQKFKGKTSAREIVSGGFQVKMLNLMTLALRGRFFPVISQRSAFALPAARRR